MGDAKKTKIEEITNFSLHPSSSAQPNILLRLPIFTPSNRTKSKSGHHLDVSPEFNNLEFSNKNGYEKVTILGSKMSLETDFKVWCGLVQIINENNFKSIIRVGFIEFAKRCGYGSNRINKALRKTLEGSFLRIQNQSIQFSKRKKNDEKAKSYTGGLVNSVEIDEENDFVEIKIDEKLIEIYKVDHVILLQLKILSKLARQETAQCIFVYLASLPANPYDIGFDKLRERVRLTSSEKEQNRSITNAIKRLKDIGYLNAEIYTKQSKRFLKIKERCQYLSLNKLSENQPEDINAIGAEDRAVQTYVRIEKQRELEKITLADIINLEAHMPNLMMQGFKFDHIAEQFKLIKLSRDCFKFCVIV